MIDGKKKRSRVDGNPVQPRIGVLRAARLGTIKTDILDNLRQPTLSIHAVAGRHGISVRYLRELFAADGTSFADFVLEQRLAAVHRMLCDARSAGRTVGAIAFAAGFGDLADFDRTFRLRYGATPSEVRAAAMQKDK